MQTDRFTYKDRFHYFNIGVKHGALELLFTFLLFPLLAFIIPDYVHAFTGRPVNIFMQIAFIFLSLIPLVIYFMFLFTLVGLYAGKITKLAVMPLLAGGTIIMFITGIFASLFFLTLYGISGFKNIGHYFVNFFALADYFIVSPKEKINYSLLFYKLIRPSFLEISILFAVIFGISAILPWLVVGYKAFYQKISKKTLYSK
ncbi:MAG: hypothetical protein ACYCSQ_00795 [bacterium]